MKTKKIKFLAFDVGCLECGEDSNVIGFFNNEKEAEDACNKASAKQHQNWHGQHDFRVFDISKFLVAPKSKKSSPR